MISKIKLKIDSNSWLEINFDSENIFTDDYVAIYYKEKTVHSAFSKEDNIHVSQKECLNTILVISEEIFFKWIEILKN